MYSRETCMFFNNVLGLKVFNAEIRFPQRAAYKLVLINFTNSKLWIRVKQN